MRFPGHLVGGWTAARYITQWLKPSSVVERRKLLVIGTIAGILPDLDWIWYAIHYGLKYDSGFRHHTWITHTIPFYWIPALVLYIVGVEFGKQNFKKNALVFAVGAAMHIIQDSIGSGDGIMWFYPFSRAMYGIGLLGVHGAEWEKVYRKSRIYFVEITIVIFGMILFIHDLLRRQI